MDEILDVFDAGGNKIGEKWKSFCYSSENTECYFKLAWVWIVNDHGEILVQKRALCKALGPGLWDMSAAGHVARGETPLDAAVRETFEELGITETNENFKFIGEWKNIRNKNFAYIYFLKYNLPANNFVLQQEEVSEVKWLPLDEFSKLFFSDSFCAHAVDYKEWVLNKLADFLNREK